MMTDGNNGYVFKNTFAAPSISNFTVIRANSSHFNATLSFNYLGADDAIIHEICYRREPLDPYIEPICNNTAQWQRDHLTSKAELDLSSSASLTSKLAFKVNVTNTASFTEESEWVTETTGMELMDDFDMVVLTFN